MARQSLESNTGWMQRGTDTPPATNRNGQEVAAPWTCKQRAGGVVGLVLLMAVSSGCASDNGGESGAESSGKAVVPPITSTREGDKMIRRFDVNDDGRADIEKVYDLVTSNSESDSSSSESEDGSSSSASTREEVLREKRIDVNADGTYDIVRFYDEQRNMVRESVDIDRDGNSDWTSYFDEGTIARKEMFADDGSTVTSTRYYDGEGELERVEVDRNDDDKIDYWEYYESGRITRIGRDVDGDEEADSWDRRRKKTSAGGDAPSLGEQGAGSGESSGDTSGSDGDSGDAQDAQDSGGDGS
jgi:hypothetical protein